VPKDEIAGNDYDLSINGYKEIEYEEIEYEAPEVIISQLQAIELEIAEERSKLERLL